MYTQLFQYLEIIIQLQDQLLAVLLGHAEADQQEEWLDSADVKRLLKISDRTLYRLRTTGQLPARKIGGKWYYPHSALWAQMNERP